MSNMYNGSASMRWTAPNRGAYIYMIVLTYNYRCEVLGSLSSNLPAGNLFAFTEHRDSIMCMYCCELCLLCSSCEDGSQQQLLEQAQLANVM